MKASYLTTENKITVYTNPEYQGADIPDEYMKRPKDTDVPVNSLYGLEPDDKMKAKEHADTMLALALKMRKGWTPDPIIVVKTSKGYMILDGHHRWHAARKAGVETLPAVVVDKGDLKYTNEIPEGKLAKAAGAAALAGACIAGTPGCAVTSVKDVAKGVQTVGRTAQTVKDMGRAGAEEELYNILRQKLRNVKEGNVEEDSIYQQLKRKFGAVSHKADYDKVAQYLHNEIVKASKGGAPQHGLGYYAQQIAKEFEGIDYRALIDVYKKEYGLEGLSESLDQPYRLDTPDYMYYVNKWTTKANSPTHTIKFLGQSKDKKKGPGLAWEFEFGTRPHHSGALSNYEVTGEGDAQRILATAVAAIKLFVNEVDPSMVTFTADKGDDGTSRTKLYQRMVQRLAPQLGFKPIVQKGDAMDTFTLVKEADKMGGIDVGSSIQNAREEWRAWIQSLPTQLAQEFIDERPNPDQEDIDVFTKLRLTSKTPVMVSTKELLKQPWMKGSISRTPQPVVDAINKRYGTNFKSGTVYDRDPDRFFRYAKMTANTAKPSVMVDGDVIFGVGRMIAALLRGDASVPVWNLKTVATESASGYIPSAKEKNDPRFKTALTVDVKPGETQRQAAKLGMKIDKKGSPPLLHKSAAKNTSANKAYNLGLTESLMAKYKALKESQLDEEELVEISQTPGAIRDWASSDAANGIIAGFEAEVILPDIGGLEYDEDRESDMSEDRRPRSIDDVLDFLSFDDHGFGLYGSAADDLRDTLRERYTEWVDDQIMNAWEYDEFKTVMEDEGWLDDIVKDEIDAFDVDDVAQEIFKKDYDELDDDDKDDVNSSIADRANEAAEETMLKMWDGETGFYGDALESFREMKYSDRDLEEDEYFEQNFPYMSDITDTFGVDWPYIEGNVQDEGAWEDFGDMMQKLVGKKVVVSTGYHSESRGDYYIIEPDSSISPDSTSDAGVEIVSPPMPLATAQQQLLDVAAFLKRNDAYTNDSTGLHMGISLPDNEENLDYVKLVLFTGDRYMLEQFDRSYNSYARSAIEKMETAAKEAKRKNFKFERMNIKSAMDALRNGINKEAAEIVRGRTGQDKYTSIHIKQGYIEFRIAGGDYLNKVEEAELAMLRFARAYTIASDPNAEREEYQKKLFKLINSEDPAENIWAQYQAGQINAEDLKDQWANNVLGIDPEAGKQDAFGERTYNIVRLKTGDVVKDIFARDEEEAQELFQNWLKQFGDDSIHDNFKLVDPTKANKEPAGRKGEVAKRLQGRTRIFQFVVPNPQDWEKAKAGVRESIMKAVLREDEVATFNVPATSEVEARKKLPYYADWITPNRASQIELAKVMPVRGELPKEPDYTDKEFGFAYKVLQYGDLGPELNIVITAPNRASAIDKLRQGVRKKAGTFQAAVKDLKDIDPGSVDMSKEPEAEAQSYNVEVRIFGEYGTTFKTFTVKAASEQIAIAKAEEYVKSNSPRSNVTARIPKESKWRVISAITGESGNPVRMDITVDADTEEKARNIALMKLQQQNPNADVRITYASEVN